MAGVVTVHGRTDHVIADHSSQPKLIAALRMLETKRDTNPPKKHGNVPL